MRNFFFLLFLGLGVFACVQAPEGVTGRYLNLDSLLSEQERQILQSGVRLSKEVTLGDSTQTLLLEGDSASLASELKVFRAIDPSQPQYLNAFQISRDNAGAEVYTNIDGSAELSELQVQRMGQYIQSITGVVSEKTAIYAAYRRMKLNFQEGTLSSYTVEGYQKMIFSDTVFFAVKTSLERP